MSTSSRQQAARQRAREQAAARAAAEAAARRKRLYAVSGAIAVVVVVALVFVIVKLVGGGGKPAGPTVTGTAAAAVTEQLSKVDAGTFNSVGKGKVSALPTALTGQPALTDGGKPLVVYIGAEYCPYCAAERWAVVAALSRFGTFSNLGLTSSASQDVYPNTATLSFHGSSYASQYLVFQGVETESNQPQGSGYAPLDTLTAQQQALIQKYDAAPYVPSSSAGAIPFVDLGNKYLISGASYDPQVLAGKSAAQIAAAMNDPSSPIAQAVDGTANAVTAALCKLTNGQPGAVCTSPAVAAYAGQV